MDQLFVLGLNHKAAPIEVRERLAFGPERLPKVLATFHAALAGEGNTNTAQNTGCTVLSTCNRTEIYASICGRELTVAKAIQRFQETLYDYAQLSKPALDRMLYCYHGRRAADHLFRVSAGLDSLVLGESEILGQVRAAHQSALDAGLTSPHLCALFQNAITCGKRVRTETEIGRAGRSVATVVVELAQEKLGSLHTRTALLIGAGKISALTARALVSAGLQCVIVANRTYTRAQNLAYSLGEQAQAKAVHFDALEEYLPRADIVICSTGAPHIVLHAETVSRSLAYRESKSPLLVADLAVPRDADPDIASLPGVDLVVIDDLRLLAERRLPFTADAVSKAERIVQDEVEKYERWLSDRQCTSLIRALRNQAETIASDEVNDVLKRLSSLTPEDQEAVERLAHNIVAKLLHSPITSLKQRPDCLSPEEWERTIEHLFNLNLEVEGKEA